MLIKLTSNFIRQILRCFFGALVVNLSLPRLHNPRYGMDCKNGSLADVIMGGSWFVENVLAELDAEDEVRGATCVQFHYFDINV